MAVERANNHRTHLPMAESSINRATAQAIPHHNLNSTLPLLAMTKAVPAVTERIQASLETMLRCRVDSIAEGHLMSLWEVTYTMDNSIKASSSLDRRQDKAIQVLEGIVDSRDGGNLTKRAVRSLLVCWFGLS